MARMIVCVPIEHVFAEDGQSKLPRCVAHPHRRRVVLHDLM